MPRARKTMANARYTVLFFLANSGPTEEIFLQWGHRDSAFVTKLNKNVSWQWPQQTRVIPGSNTGGVTGLGARFMILILEITYKLLKLIEHN